MPFSALKRPYVPLQLRTSVRVFCHKIASLVGEATKVKKSGQGKAGGKGRILFADRFICSPLPIFTADVRGSLSLDVATDLFHVSAVGVAGWVVGQKSKYEYGNKGQDNNINNDLEGEHFLCLRGYRRLICVRAVTTTFL